MKRLVAALVLTALPAGGAADAPRHGVVPLDADGAKKTRGAPYEIVSGDPRTPGAPFVIRIYNYDNMVVPPHSHPEDEHITVLKGAWFLGHGDVFDRASLREMAVGDYAMVPRKMHHFAWSKGDTVIQVHGIGPFAITFADPWMLLSRPADAARFKFRDGERVESKSRGIGFVREGVFSEKNQVKQYVVERADGGAFWEFEAELEARPATVQAPAPQKDAALDALVTGQMVEAGIVGLGAAVIVDRQVVWMKGYGFADWQRTRPFTPDTVMNVGSIAKPVVGVAMMRAVQEGKLALDEDINAYLPFRVVNPHRPQEKITLRHLATHTSGITDRPEVYFRTYHYGGDSPEPLGRFLEQYFTRGGAHYAPDNFLDARPGERRDYSNIGAGLAGYIVERAFGEPLNVYTRKHVFEPLGMTRTAWFLSEVDLANHSTLFVSQNGMSIPIPLYGGTTYPDGGLRTSVADLSKFFIALLDDGQHAGVRILDEEKAAEMLRFQFTDANRPQNYPATEGNSGLFWRTKFDGTRVGHGGNDPGLQTDMLADTARNVGVILFVNTSLSGNERRAYGAIFDALWKHGESLRQAGPTVRR